MNAESIYFYKSKKVKCSRNNPSISPSEIRRRATTPRVVLSGLEPSNSGHESQQHHFLECETQTECVLVEHVSAGTMTDNVENLGDASPVSRGDLFPDPVSEEMAKALRKVSHWAEEWPGMRPWPCSREGEFYRIDWSVLAYGRRPTFMGGAFAARGSSLVDWHEEWRRLVQGGTSAVEASQQQSPSPATWDPSDSAGESGLWSPPLMLPRQLGGFTLLLQLARRGADLLARAEWHHFSRKAATQQGAAWPGFLCDLQVDLHALQSHGSSSEPEPLRLEQRGVQFCLLTDPQRRISTGGTLGGGGSVPSDTGPTPDVDQQKKKKAKKSKTSSKKGDGDGVGFSVELCRFPALPWRQLDVERPPVALLRISSVPLRSKSASASRVVTFE